MFPSLGFATGNSAPTLARVGVPLCSVVVVLDVDSSFGESASGRSCDVPGDAGCVLVRSSVSWCGPGVILS